MKSFTLARKTILTLSISTMLGASLQAKTIDVSKSQKDIRVMSKILETSLEPSDKEFPGSVRIKGTYLANQGYLFTIQLNGLGSFGFPGLASWDNGRLELDIPEIVSTALANVEFDEDMEDYIPDGIKEKLEEAAVADELKQEKLREIREQQRQVRRDLYQLKRELRHVEEEKAKAEIEKQLASREKDLVKYQNSYKKSLNSYKQDRIEKRVSRSTDAVNAIFDTVCDYGQSMKSLKSSEWVTLVVKGGVDKQGKTASLVYVLSQKNVKNCSSGKTLKSQSTHYSM